MKIRFSIYIWLFVALIIRLYKISLVRCIAADGVAYIGVAKDWLTGMGFHPIWPPLYPWFISLLLRIGIGSELSGQLVSAIFGVATVLMVYMVTKSVFSPRVSQISTIFCVFQPYLVRYSSEVLADSLFMFLIISCVFCGWLLIQNKRLVSALLTGFLTSLAYLTKPEGIFLLFIISLWHRKLWHIFYMWIIFLLVSFPYIYSIRNQTGEWMISRKQNIVFSVALQEEGLSTEFLDISPMKYARENPVKFFKKVGTGFLTLLGRFPDACHPLLFIFLMIGLISGIKEKRFLFYVFTFLVPYFIGYAVFHPGRRYLVGWVPIIIFLSSYGIIWISRWTKGVWIPILFTVLVMLPKTLEPIRVAGAKWKKMGQWIKSNPGVHVKIPSEDRRVDFYAGN